MELDTYYLIHFLHGLMQAWGFIMGVWIVQ